MQLSAQMFQADLHVLLGWVSIVVGLALAVQTLAGARRPKSGVAHILRAYRPAEWSARQSAHERIRPMDPASQVQRLKAIAEDALTQTEAIVNLQARAAQELEAVDDALVRLLADHAPAAVPPTQPREIAPAPVPIAEPLAA
jgi:hypothetical protein